MCAARAQNFPVLWTFCSVPARCKLATQGLTHNAGTLLCACIFDSLIGPRIVCGVVVQVLTPILDRYAKVFAYEMDGESAYFFHPPQSGFDRPMESSAWSGWVKRLFKRHAGVEIAPKTLRSVFITWLRDNTAAPEILKSAAHAMKHSEERQASKDYDQESDDRTAAHPPQPKPTRLQHSVHTPPIWPSR